MNTVVIRKDIFDKIVAYDAKKKTNFATLLSQKVNSANGAYTRGVVHGLCLALTHSGVISNADAQDILYELDR